MASGASYAAFLRGMNVGGHRLTNSELEAHFRAIGLCDIRTFRASGNVVFAAEERTPAQLGALIEAGLEAALGYAVPSYIRSAEQLLEIAASEPFTAEELLASGGKLQVALLARAPSTAARRRVLALASEQDRLAFGPCELYWLPSGGLLESQLDLKAIAAELGAMTTRTKGTMEQMASKFFAG